MSDRGFRRWAASGLALLALAGCDLRSKGAGAGKTVVAINGLKMSGDELKAEKAMAAWAPEGKEAPGAGGEPEWLSRVIERELLVQEAQRMGLDRDPDFMGTIERFWKEALMRELLRWKSQEIVSQVRVYEPEIEERHARLLKQDPSVGPLPQARAEIERMVRHEKEQRAMEDWAAELRARARIQVDEEAIARLK